MNGLILFHQNHRDINAIVEYSKKTRHRLYLPREYEYFTFKDPAMGYGSRLNSLKVRLKQLTPARAWNKVLRFVFGTTPDDTQYLIYRVRAMTHQQFKQMAEDLKLDFVILPYDGYPWLKNFIGYCKREGIPVIVVRKEGIPFPLLLPLELSEPFIADYLCCVGMVQCRIWEKQGVPADRLFVTGYPRMDYYQQPEKWPAREAVFAKFGLDPSKKTVLFPAQTAIPDDINIDFSRLKRETMQVLFALARKHPEIQIIVKPHVKQQMVLTGYELLARLRLVKNFVLVPDSIDIRDLITNVDLIVAGNSTTLMEGMIVGKPTILTKWDTAMQPGFLEYHEWKASPTALSKEELGPMILDLLDKGKPPEEMKAGREKIVYEYLYKQDGKACERIFEAVELVERSSDRLKDQSGLS